jgi:hypothetical protein
MKVLDNLRDKCNTLLRDSQGYIKKMACEWQLTVDPDLRDLLIFDGDNHEQRVKMLEAQIIEEGCRDPLVVWRETGIIVDGNTRYDICLRNNIPFAVVFMHFDSKSEAMQWAKENQANRRNMTTPQSIEVTHKIEGQIRAEAKERQIRKPANSVVPNLAQQNEGRSRDKLADMAGVGHTTYQKGTHILDNAPEPIKQAWKSEDLSTDAAYQATKLPEERQRKIIDEAERGEKPIKQIVNDAIKAEREVGYMQEAAVAFSSGEAYNLDNLVEEVIENGEDCVDAIRTQIETRITLFDSAGGRIADAIDKIINSFVELKREVNEKWK